MSPRPLVFISAVSRELKSARQLVANTLTFLGYQPVWQEIFGTESGDLREILRQQIDHCKGVVQLVGQCYGAEPPTADKEFGRVSYTQYEAFYARKRGKKVWYLFIDENFPADDWEVEPQDVRELQAAYRRRLQSDTHVFHPLTSSEGLEASVLKLRDDLTRLRRGAKQWAFAVGLLLVITVALGVWILQRQQHTSEQLVAMQTKMDELLHKGIMEYPQLEAQARQSQTGEDATAPKKPPRERTNFPAQPREHRASENQIAVPYGRNTARRFLPPKEPAREGTNFPAQPRQPRASENQIAVQERVYVELGKQLGLDPKVLREKLPKFAEELKHASNTSNFERANAAYVAKDYAEAERLALQTTDEAQRAVPSRPSDALAGLKLAALSAMRRFDYARALEHLRRAEKLIDPDRNPKEWSDVQNSIRRLFREAAWETQLPGG